MSFPLVEKRGGGPEEGGKPSTIRETWENKVKGENLPRASLRFLVGEGEREQKKEQGRTFLAALLNCLISPLNNGRPRSLSGKKFFHDISERFFSLERKKKTPLPFLPRGVPSLYPEEVLTGKREAAFLMPAGRRGKTRLQTKRKRGVSWPLEWGGAKKGNRSVKNLSMTHKEGGWETALGQSRKG